MIVDLQVTTCVHTNMGDTSLAGWHFLLPEFIDRLFYSNKKADITRLHNS